MFGNIGFSYIGLIYLILLFIPNFLWAKYKPIGYENIVNNENKILLVFEKNGQMLVSCTLLIFNNYNIYSFSMWSFWLVISFTSMILYELCWIKYFNSKKELKDFYKSCLGIPVPLATLPIIAFIFLGIYGKVIWLIISSIILGIGHMGIHLNHYKDINNN